MKKEITYGRVFLDTAISGKRRGIAGYIPVELYPIWKELKQDCIECDMSLSYDGMTELLIIYKEVRNIIMSTKPEKRENIFEEMHQIINEMTPVKEAIKEKVTKKSKIFSRNK